VRYHRLELHARLARQRLRQQRLARAGRAVQQQRAQRSADATKQLGVALHTHDAREHTQAATRHTL
jgi:hypothetical protein